MLLTLFLRNYSLIPAFLIDSCTQQCVKEFIDKLYELLDEELFNNAFSILLTDNGSELKNPEALEYDNNGIKRTNIFYCNPMGFYQKPHIEKR